jgi:molybdate transport system substrate-binding protein
MMKRTVQLLVVVLLVVALAAGIAVAESSTQITVSAAISLKNAFEELGKLFEAQNKDLKVTFNFGASGDLVAQIKGGAPVDVFASAALKDMDVLEADGLVIKDTRANFAGNTLVLVKPASSKITISSFEDLKKPEVKKIAAGNPKTVPAGRYADEAFQNLKIVDAVKDKLIFAENVRQVLDYVARAEVDAGVVYATDAKARASEVAVIATAPESSHKPVLYPIAAVKGSKNEKASRAFIALIRSAEGMKVLEKYGFKAIK